MSPAPGLGFYFWDMRRRRYEQFELPRVSGTELAKEPICNLKSPFPVPQSSFLVFRCFYTEKLS